MSPSTRPPRQDPPGPQDRKARLAEALKSNIARRKAQAAAKSVARTADTAGRIPASPQDKDT